MTSAAFEFFERSNSRAVIGVGLVLVVVVGLVDYRVPREVDLLILYLVPIALASWFVHWRVALGLAGLAVLAAFLADLLAGPPHPSSGAEVWNAVAQAGILAAFSSLLFALKQAFQRQERLTQVDTLTGLQRSELFYEVVDRQVKIAIRHGHPLTFAYIGVDNFHALNERYGRQTGDTVLVAIAQALKQNLRDTDILARLGGDEFAVFLPETGSYHAGGVVEKILKRIGEATEGWPITFSVGAVVCDHTTYPLDHLVRTAEGLMRSVKKSGVNNFELQILEARRQSEVANERSSGVLIDDESSETR